jgi:hypothetical protein
MHYAVLATFALCLATPCAAAEIYVVGALHRLHATEPAFSYADLRRVIEAVRPEVMLLEVRPDELAERKDTPGRPEYPAVVWPMLPTMKATALPMEPGGATFQAMVDEASAQFAAFAKDNPVQSAYNDNLRLSLETALQAHWRHPADAHDRVTSDLVRAQALALETLAGQEFTVGQAEWDGYMVEQARTAIRANPGKRILVLGSFRNRAAFLDGLKGEGKLVEMDAWLRSTLPPR